ncbi:DoxX family membrane protein [Evansella halocellulosilytica]|uniref:DoxX family membrane protein n=1 Tax=Evansella halocellulosilytica TaxID=2011013 RepID=UPI000BB8C634|nr:DoxX family membrane protein [Evansella halocellulosilytica]
MKKALIIIARLVLGIIFLGAGINGFVVAFGFEPFIETSDEAMQLFEFQYLLIFEKSLEVICGMLLILNRFVPLALAVLAPIIANILLLHIFVDYSLLLLAILLFICHAFLLIIYKNNFVKIFEKKPL